ncbi:MAG: hypothetical protein M3O20_12355 [Acidobacteriota bacterium]|nr:hypothetical protein [Acidobacteriota bacterium]
MRSAIDRQYCSAEHRKEARLASANALREEEEDQEIWSVAQTRRKPRASSSSQSAPVFAFLALGALLVAMLMLPGNSASRGSSFPSGPADPGTRQGLIERAAVSIGDLVRDSAPVTLHQDFRVGIADWTTSTLHAANTAHAGDPRDWKLPTVPTLVAPGSLSIWNRTTGLTNYQMEFQGQIQKRSLSWAFRASNAANYYAAKIVIAKPGQTPNAGLVHFAMLNGHEFDRVQLPLPVTLSRGENYRVRVSVQDNHFVTYLDGQAISSWTDARLNRGGVGFFADEDDEQRVSWINLSERDSFLGRMLAHFSLFLIPQMQE